MSIDQEDLGAVKKERLAVVAPVLPFRGGIAQHSTMLIRSLGNRAELLVLSFNRLYPAWLFPGESDRDPAYQNYLEPNTNYVIDSINPFSWRRAVIRIVRYRPDAVLIPWWTFFLGPCFWYIARALDKRNISVIFLCHNAFEHENAWWKRFTARAVLRHGQGYVVHTREDQTNLEKQLGNVRVCVHPHPIYEQFPPARGELAKRAGLELLYYGFVRSYKGVDVLAQALTKVKDQDIFLTIAGEFWEDREEIEHLIESSGMSERVEVRPRFHTEQETAELFARSDIVVLPYRSATGSGVIPLAYHYGKPVLVTHVGGLADVVSDGETGFVVEPESPQALATIIAGLTRAQCDEMRPAIENYRAGLSWDGLAEAVFKAAAH